MAAPNIVNVTSIIGKTALVSVGTSGTSVVANASGSGKVFKVSSLYVANVDGAAAADISVYITRSATQYYVAYTISVPPDSTLDIINKHLYLEEGDTLSALASVAGDIQVVCSYEEIS